MGTTLNDEQRKLLTIINDDKFSAGPFAGMIFNAIISSKAMVTDENLDHFIQTALKVRVRMQQLTK